MLGTDHVFWRECRDGYYHYSKPADFEDVCSLIDISVALAYTTFGLAALQMSVVFAFAGYILLYLDQEVSDCRKQIQSSLIADIKPSLCRPSRSRRTTSAGVPSALASLPSRNNIVYKTARSLLLQSLPPRLRQQVIPLQLAPSRRRGSRRPSLMQGR